MAKPWEFNSELDTDKSYNAFKIYRDLGPKRTLEAAYAVHKAGNRSKEAPGFWKKWGRNGNWTERARAFDAENDRINAEERRRKSQSEHDEKIESMRKVLEQTAFYSLNSALLSAQIVAAAIEEVKRKSTIVENGKTRLAPNSDQINTLAVLSKVRSSDSSAIVAAISIADEALGISMLQKKLEAES